MKAMVGALFLACVVLLASAAEVPTHVHLFLTGNLSTLQVSFSTTDKPTAPGVTYWITSTDPITVDASASDIHTFTHPTTKAVEYITSVAIEVDRASVYSYYAYSDKSDSSSRTSTFTYHSLPEDEAVLNIGIYGDMGAYGSAIEAKGKGGLPYWASNHKFDFIVHNGDLAYNLGSDSGKVGQEFLDNIEQVTSIIPYMVTPGNHEFMDESESYYNNWFLGQTDLGKTSGSTDEIMWYSFDVGTKLHIVVISTEVYCEDTDNIAAQHAWLEKDLAAVRARDVQPWIIVFGHRQIYIDIMSTLHSRLMRLGLQCTNSTLEKCDLTTPCKSGKDCGYSIESLFNEYHVDIYFAGHVHTYVRMYPIASNLTYETQNDDTYVNAQSPVYIVSGAAGTQSKPSVEHMDQANMADPSPTAKSAAGYTFSYFQVYNNSYLTLNQINVTDGSIVDTFAMVKDPAQPAWKKAAIFALDSDIQTKCDQ